MTWHHHVIHAAPFGALLCCITVAILCTRHIPTYTLLVESLNYADHRASAVHYTLTHNLSVQDTEFNTDLVWQCTVAHVTKVIQHADARSVSTGLTLFPTTSLLPSVPFHVSIRCNKQLLL